MTATRSMAASGLLGAVIALSQSHPAVAADARLGASIAAAKCARCHAVGATGDSPARAAPPFRELAGEPIAMLEDARSNGIVSGHDEMPMFEMTPAEVDGLIAYINSLARGTGRPR